jgi:hypothetical protein
MENAVSKQVQETSVTSAGLELAIRWLEGYQAFTKEDYSFISNLAQQVAPAEESKLLEAFAKLSEKIIEVQNFITAEKQSQSALPASTPVAAGQTVNAAQPGPMLNAPAVQGSTPGPAAPPPAQQPGPAPAQQTTVTNLFLALLSSEQVQGRLTGHKIDGNLVVSQTKDLQERRTPKPPLSDTALSNLIESWKIAMDFFTGKQFPEDPDNPHPDLASIAGLIEIHAQLEVLYEQLITISEETGVASLLSLY